MAENGSVQDLSGAGATMPIKSGTALPATCTASKEFFNKTDGAVGSRLYRCNGAGNGWVALDGGGGSGGSNHAQLTNLDYANSGHTGFAPNTHASTHKSGQSDPLATVTPTASAIPQSRLSDSGGTLHPDWLPVMIGDTGSEGSFTTAGSVGSAKSVTVNFQAVETTQFRIAYGSLYSRTSDSIQSASFGSWVSCTSGQACNVSATLPAGIAYYRVEAQTGNKRAVEMRPI